MTTDYTQRKEEAFALPPVPAGLSVPIGCEHLARAYGHACAEHVRAEITPRVVEVLKERDRLRAEVETLRAALSQCATAVGASAAQDCSVEFLACVPREVELVLEKFRADAERLEWLSLKWGGLRGDYAAWVLRRGGTGDLSDIRSFVDAASKGEGS